VNAATSGADGSRPGGESPEPASEADDATGVVPVVKPSGDGRGEPPELAVQTAPLPARAAGASGETTVLAAIAEPGAETDHTRADLYGTRTSPEARGTEAVEASTPGAGPGGDALGVRSAAASSAMPGAGLGAEALGERVAAATQLVDFPTPGIEPPLEEPGYLADQPDVRKTEVAVARGAPHGLQMAVLFLAALLVIAVVALVVSRIHPSWFHAQTSPGTPQRSTRSVTQPRTSPPHANTGGPTLQGVQPASGASGQSVTISGANLVSANGSIVAYFGPTATSTRCPSENQCTAVVPPRQGGAGTVAVRLRTAAGYSNAVSFRYR
jgi:hypothetical protein